MAPEKEGFVMTLMSTVTGILAEAGRVPPLALATGARVAQAFLSSRTPTREDVDIYLHGGAFAPPFMSLPYKYYLDRTVPNAPTIHLPHGTLTGIKDFTLYFAAMQETIEKQGKRKRIHDTFSLGGLVGLIDLCLNPDDVSLVILKATALHLEQVDPQIRKAFVHRMLGIEMEHLPSPLEAVKTTLQSPTLRKKIVVLASKRDFFFPPEACIIEGAEYKILETPTHVDFMNSLEVFDAGRQILTAAIPHLHLISNRPVPSSYIAQATA